MKTGTKPDLRAFIAGNGVLIAFVLMFIVSAAMQPGVFLRPENLRNLVNQNVPVGFLAIGMTLVIIAGGIDLAAGSLLALAAVLSMLALNHFVGLQQESLGILIAVGTGLAVGVLGGLLNGFIITKGKVTPFIATLCGLLAYRSTANGLTKASELRSLSPDVWPSFAKSGVPIPFLPAAGNQPFTITWPMILFFVVAGAFSVLLGRTKFGRHCIAVGSNEVAARYSGINTAQVRIATYALLGLCIGIAAVSQSSRFNSVSSAQMGQYYELDAIAAVVIGGARLSGGYGKIWSTVLGVLLLGIITNMLQTSGISDYWQGVVKGVIILLAVLVQRDKDTA